MAINRVVSSHLWFIGLILHMSQQQYTANSPRKKALELKFHPNRILTVPPKEQEMRRKSEKKQRRRKKWCPRWFHPFANTNFQKERETGFAMNEK